jgi:hypothetical protein
MPMTTRTTVRWTDHEFAEVKQYADRQNISLSVAIRELLLKHIPQPARPSRFPWLS